MQASRREFLRDLPGLQEAYDPRAQAPGHIVAMLKRYDPALILRYNRAIERWELWRFNGSVIPSNIAMVTPEEWTRRASFQFTLEGGGPAEEKDPGFRWRRRAVRAIPDWRIRRAIWVADEWRRLGITREQYRAARARDLEQRDADQKAKENEAERQELYDLHVDQYRQLKALMGRAHPIFVMGSGQGKH